MAKKRIRFLYMFLVGIGVSAILGLILPNPNIADHKFFHYLTSIVITVLVWEGNLRIDNLMNRAFPWLEKPGKRILVHLPVSVIYSALTIFLLMLFFDAYICKIPNTNRMALMVSSITIGLLITIIILSLEIGAQFFSNWKKSLVEVEKYRAESVQAQLESLKNQINPHFLFNNMSVLSSLVYQDQDKAVDFINQLSKVYRYLLDIKNTELVTLDAELNFIKSYTYLLQIRFDKNIVFTTHIDEACKNLLLPPIAIQVLVENAIKHNEVSAEKPLHVEITAVGKLLQVRNNLQPRAVAEESSKTGLQNIKDRYKHFTGNPIEISNSDNHFTVKLPLLQST